MFALCSVGHHFPLTPNSTFRSETGLGVVTTTGYGR